MDTISQAVGIRYGTTVMPNNPDDVQTITGLLDRIPSDKGGTADAPGEWSDDPPTLVQQVTDAITGFQTTNTLPIIDGAVDPNGNTLMRLNLLAGPGPIRATVVRSESGSRTLTVADPWSLDGSDPLDASVITGTVARALVRVPSSSITWYGVVVPVTGDGSLLVGSPHIFFTPTPALGGYMDPGYDSFTSWIELWTKYTTAIGVQIAAAGVAHVLVIPFYKNSQYANLGDFVTNWKEVVSAVGTAAINSFDPLFLRDRYTFDKLFSSSFSSGVVALQDFHTRGVGVTSMSQMAFNLDGQASGSHWNPSRGVIYRNTPVYGGPNPVGMRWSVGGRLAALRPAWPGVSDHNLCPFLLFHGLTMFGK
jgi:hypothetical protein